MRNQSNIYDAADGRLSVETYNLRRTVISGDITRDMEAGLYDIENGIVEAVRDEKTGHIIP